MMEEGGGGVGVCGGMYVEGRGRGTHPPFPPPQSSIQGMVQGCVNLRGAVSTVLAQSTLGSILQGERV